MINKTPALGRLVVRKSDHPDHFIDITAIGRVSKIKGKQITYDRRVGPTETENTESRLMLDWTVAVVCDTEGELAEIVKYDQMAAKKLSDLRDELQEGWFTAIGGAQ